MIDLEIYRIRIGIFNLTQRKSRFKKSINSFRMENEVLLFNRILRTSVLVFASFAAMVLPLYSTESESLCFFKESTEILPSSDTASSYQKIIFETSVKNLSKYQCWQSALHGQLFIPLGKKCTTNFRTRCLYGNIGRGLKNIHINVRSLYNKVSEVKNFILREKPHIIGISEAELVKSYHSVEALKIPGYDLIMPKSWTEYDRARIVVYVKKGLIYQQISDLECKDVQSIWIRAGFKNCKLVYYSHVYREHTNTLGNSIACQRTVLSKMLSQWEEAVSHGNFGSPNEVHVAGDMNLDSHNGRWLTSKYPLVSLSRLVVDTCNAYNFHQVVKNITRVQYNSVSKETSTSCIDHLYCNAQHRISPVQVISFGSSDHDAISYVRFAKEPKPPSRVIMKRSYKNFNKENFLSDLSNLDFGDVYGTLDVDMAADLLTQKLVNVLDYHAPWIKFQQRKNYVPWITIDTVKLMAERDEYKKQAKALSLIEGNGVSPEQAGLWRKYKQLRNQINNKIKREERLYKQAKLNECQESVSQTWDLSKSFMNWKTAGPPTQLEVEEGNGVTLKSKACEIANIMNSFFLSKVQQIVNQIRDIP